MTARPVILRQVAQRDIAAAVDHYAAEAGAAVALRFVDAVEAALLRIGRHPGIGSPRYGYALAIEGLRAWPLPRFPYLVFYREEAAQVDVWRVLHAERDIAAWMREEFSGGRDIAG